MKKILFIILLSLTMSNCSQDFLDRSSLTSLASETFWKSEDDVLMALAGCYSTLQSNHLYNSYPWGGGLVRWDYLTDDGFVRWEWIRGTQVALGTYSTNEGLLRDFWKTSYEAIVRCNRIIDIVPTLGEDVISEKSSKQIVAEAKFIRALIYNLLSATFENVPLITTQQSVSESHVPKNTKTEILDFILTDLEGSVEDLGESGSVDWGRATKGAGYALLARINLYNEKWEDAVSWSGKVMDLNYSLYPDFASMFQSSNEINDEVIFPVRFIRGPEGVGARFAGYYGPSLVPHQDVLSNLGEDYFDIEGKPISVSTLYNPNKPAENRDPRMGATLVANGSLWKGDEINTFNQTWLGYSQRKYTEEGNDDDHFDASTDFYVFRLGHVICLRAEALAMINASINKTEIFDLINQLRDRQSVHMSHVTQTEVDNYFGGSILDMVRHERRIETAFEGLRYIDLKRWGMLKERAVDLYMSYEKPKDDRLSVRQWRPEHVIWPIPQEEMDKNDALVQDSLWK